MANIGISFVLSQMARCALLYTAHIVAATFRAQVGAGKPSERRPVLLLAAGGGVPLAVASSGGRRRVARTPGVALLNGRPQSQASHAQGELGSRDVAIATRQHLSQAVLDSGIVGSCEVSGVQRSQQVRATGSCAVQEE